jgi:uncharacterized repeat protein (TIGR02543 family)
MGFTVVDRPAEAAHADIIVGSFNLTTPQIDLVKDGKPYIAVGANFNNLRTNFFPEATTGFTFIQGSGVIDHLARIELPSDSLVTASYKSYETNKFLYGYGGRSALTLPEGAKTLIKVLDGDIEDVVQMGAFLYKRPTNAANTNLVRFPGSIQAFEYVNDELDITVFASTMLYRVHQHGYYGYLANAIYSKMLGEDYESEPAKVAFDTGGGSDIETIVVTKGDKVEKPEDPTWFGYTFTGWTLNGLAFDFDTAIVRDITLKATWEPVTITSLKIDAIAIVTVKRGEIKQFTATVNKDATTENLEWKTANPALAEVDADGVVTVKNVIGTVVLTATDPNTGRSHSVLLRIAS